MKEITEVENKAKAEVDKLKITDLTTAANNLADLVEAAALLIVAVFTVYGAYNYAVPSWLAKILIVAGIIIGLRGAYELLRQLAEKK